MQLSDENIETFRGLHLKKFGVEITKAEAMEKGIRLVRLFEIILKHEAGKQTSDKKLQTITKV